jgi:hypothetical protein
MPKRNFHREMTDFIETTKNPNPDQTKEERDNAFWDLAVDWFNEDIAGDVTLVDGTVVTTPPIQRTFSL